MKKMLSLAGLALAFTALYSLSGFAQTPKPHDLVEQRQAAMTLLGKYFGQIAGMASGRAPYDGAVVTRNAGYLEALSKMPWDGFDPSTKGEKTDALPTVFSDTAQFKQAQELLQSEVTKLVAATRNGNEAAIKAQIGTVGKTCGNCHKSFREKH